jgi:hypothetical protein
MAEGQAHGSTNVSEGHVAVAKRPRTSVQVCERAYRACHGPLLASDDVTRGDTTLPGSEVLLYHVWPHWTAWAEFYATVRDELYAARPWRWSPVDAPTGRVPTSTPRRSRSLGAHLGGERA